MNTKILTSFLVLLLSINALGQQSLSIVYHSGIESGLNYDSNLFKVDNDYGASFGVEYTRFFNPKWGFETGFAFGLYKTNVSMPDNHIFETNEIDSEGYGFIYKLDVNGYRENINLITGELPIKLIYDNSFVSEKNMGYYFGIGAKFLIPIVEQSQVTVDNLQLNGYYPNYNLLIEDLPQHGFGTINNISSTQSTDFRPMLLLSLDGGISLKIKDVKVYLGLYGDFSLLDLYGERNVNDVLVKYSPKSLPERIDLPSGKLYDVNSVKMSSYGIQIKIPLALGDY